MFLFSALRGVIVWRPHYIKLQQYNLMAHLYGLHAIPWGRLTTMCSSDIYKR